MGWGGGGRGTRGEGDVQRVEDDSSQCRFMSERWIDHLFNKELVARLNYFWNCLPENPLKLFKNRRKKTCSIDHTVPLTNAGKGWTLLGKTESPKLTKTRIKNSFVCGGGVLTRLYRTNGGLLRKLILFDLHEEKKLIKKISLWKKLNIAIPILNHFMFYVCYFFLGDTRLFQKKNIRYSGFDICDSYNQIQWRCFPRTA